MSHIKENIFNGSVRKALSFDADLLVELGKRCFHEAFHDVTAPDDMEAYLTATFQKSKIEAQIRDDRTLIFIAEMDAEPAGYACSYPAVTPECVTDKPAIKLERIYLREKHYGRAVGDALMQTTLKESRSRGYQSIWLSSWELNDRANAFYHKWKFEIVGSQKFTVGSDVQNDFILSRKI
jgi:ribosomal protein S18 acetylase RimI-like enzyme